MYFEELVQRRVSRKAFVRKLSVELVKESKESVVETVASERVRRMY